MTLTVPSIFSERPCFTLIGGMPTNVGPVVTRLDGSRNSFSAIRVAVGHAMTRTCGVVILDETGRSGFPFATDVINERERSVATGILGNDRVSRLPVDNPGLEAAIGRSVDLQASLLVLNFDDAARLSSAPGLLATLVDTPYDVLMLHQETSPD